MNTEQMTEFDKIKEMWAGFAVTEAAREEIRKTTVCFDESELKRLQRDTTYSRNMIDRLGQPPLQSVTEILEILDLAEKGKCLTPYQLERVRKVTSGESAGTAETPGAGTAELTSDRKPATGKIKKSAPVKQFSKVMREYNVGDSVYVLPDGKIGIVCEPVNEKGVLRVQVAGRKIWLNHKRVRLHVKAEELYPDDYDMSIVFDSVENRKIRHDMSRKYTDAVITEEK